MAVYALQPVQVGGLFGGGHRHRAVVRKGNLPHQGRMGKVGVGGGVVAACLPTACNPKLSLF